MDVVVSDVSEVGVDSGELKGEVVLGEVAIRLVGGGVISHRNAEVRRCLGGLLNVRLKQHCREDPGAGLIVEAEKNEEACMDNPLEVVLGL